MITVTDPGIEVDTANWPLVIQRVGARILREDMARYTEALGKLLDRGQPFATLVIVKQRGKLEWATLNDYAQFSKAKDAAMRAHYKGVAFVFPSDAFRLLLSAILAVAPPQMPYKVFAEQAPAYDWVVAQLAVSGYRPPPVAPVLWP
jgi:hypothetical protein